MGDEPRGLGSEIQVCGQSHGGVATRHHRNAERPQGYELHCVAQLANVRGAKYGVALSYTAEPLESAPAPVTFGNARARESLPKIQLSGFDTHPLGCSHAEVQPMLVDGCSCTG